MDENLPAEIADMLRQAGHDAETVFDQDLSGCADSKIILMCASERRVLITLDIGFANVRAYPPEDFH